MFPQRFDRFDPEFFYPGISEHRLCITIVNILAGSTVGNNPAQFGWHRDQPVEIKRGLAGIVGAVYGLSKTSYVLSGA
jgi:hypothetical protein